MSNCCCGDPKQQPYRGSQVLFANFNKYNYIDKTSLPLRRLVPLATHATKCLASNVMTMLTKFILPY